MGIAELITLIKDIASLLALLVGVILSLFIFFQLAPVLELSINPTWADDSKEFLTIEFVIKNNSRVRVNRPSGRIQILEYGLQPDKPFPSRIPFEKDAFPQDSPPIQWREPEKIFTSTLQIYPGEVISLKRLYHCPNNETILFAGLQVSLKLGLWGHLTTRKKEPWRQTTTCFIVKRKEISDATLTRTDTQ